MHYAGVLAEQRHDQKMAGINVTDDLKHDWSTMVGSVQKHIKSLNWGYKSDLIKLKIKYFNSYATFQDEHTVHLNDGKS